MVGNRAVFRKVFLGVGSLAQGEEVAVECQSWGPFAGREE